ncbi:MAG: hypothetical protein J6W52_03045 [Bacteroidaceae bacterium]|nr:hypothetical protein [Bacteroidaceae bacterium]
MKKIIFIIAMMFASQNITAQYSEYMYKGEYVGTYKLDMKCNTTTVMDVSMNKAAFEILPVLAPTLYYTYTHDNKNVQLLNSNGDDTNHLRFPYLTKIDNISSQTITCQLFNDNKVKGYTYGSDTKTENVFFVPDKHGKIAFRSSFSNNSNVQYVDIYKIIGRWYLAPLQEKVKKKKEEEKLYQEEMGKREKERMEERAKNLYADVGNENFTSYVQVVKTAREYKELVGNMTCPLVIQYDASWCKPGQKSLMYFFEKAALEHKNDAKFLLINNSEKPYPTLSIYRDDKILGNRSYGVSGLHDSDWKDLKNYWEVSMIPAFIIIYNKNGEYLKISHGFAESQVNEKEAELEEALQKATKLFQESR